MKISHKLRIEFGGRDGVRLAIERERANPVAPFAADATLTLYSAGEAVSVTLDASDGETLRDTLLRLYPLPVPTPAPEQAS